MAGVTHVIVRERHEDLALQVVHQGCVLLDGCCPPVTAGEAWQSSTENISAWTVLAMATRDVLYARISDDEFGMATGIDRLRVDTNSPSVNADGRGLLGR